MRTFILIFIFSLNCLSYVLSQEAAKRVCIKDVCVYAEVVDTESARQRGLMFRENLPEGRGMFFVFEAQGRYGFWMKNMKFPIDIIWIDEEKKIVDIKPDCLPCQEACEISSPRDKALYALEVCAGFTRRNKIETGDIISIQTVS